MMSSEMGYLSRRVASPEAYMADLAKLQSRNSSLVVIFSSLSSYDLEEDEDIERALGSSTLPRTTFLDSEISTIPGSTTFVAWN